jgi:hypothetical protein
MYRTCFILIVVVAAASIAHAQTGSEVKLELKAGESAVVGPEGLVVGFDGVPSDSRCPTGVLCIWEGDAVARIWTNLESEPKETFDLHSHRSFKWKASYHGYQISLMTIAPYPHIDVPIPPGEYVASLTVTCCGSSSPVELTTWGRIKALYEE